MKARYSASVPTVISPASTLQAADPQQEAHGEEEGIGHRGGVAHPQVDPAVGELQRLLRHRIELAELVGLRGEGADHADPAEVLLHHAGQHAELFLEREPAGAQPEPRHHGAPGGEGDEAQRDQPEHRLAAEQQRRARADQDRRTARAGSGRR